MVIKWKAIAIGYGVSLVGSLLAGLIYTVILTVIFAAQGVPEAELENRILTDPSYYIATLLLGFPFVAAGGFIAGRFARGAELAHAAVVGVLGIVIGLVFVLVSDTTKWPSWYVPISFGLTVPIALLGGYLARWRAAAT